ncbi:MAG: phosphatidate cytidylyltransferase [Desulfobacterales bacterium]|jgi:phosphatidate cytidylyltransferase|nr:phosphatidate cytidylyltransferase [Desulfobacterales bacterium]
MVLKKKSQDHLKRWITGLAALPVLIGCVVAGGTLFACLVALAALVSLWEYFRIVDPSGASLFKQPVIMVGYAAGLGLILCAHAGRPDIMGVVLGLNVVIAGFLSLRRFAADRTVLESVARQIQGLCYIPLSLSLLVLLRSAADGVTWIFLLCAIIFAGDTAALYAGTLWGRHRLSPTISPGKTLEGSIAGLLAGLAVGSAAKMLFLPGWEWPACILFSIAVGIAGQVGDLFESSLKRASNVKDSGSLLPGHGGVLDRIDALLFAAPVAFGLRMYFL